MLLSENANAVPQAVSGIVGNEGKKPDLIMLFRSDRRAGGNPRGLSGLRSIRMACVFYP
jgi:hypothetical protein